MQRTRSHHRHHHRQPGLGLRRRRLGGGARGGRGRAARHRARPRASGCGGAQDAAHGGTPARASPGGSVGIRAAGGALDRAARALRRVRTLVRRDRGVPAGGRGRHRGQYRHRRDARSERPRGRGRADALLHAPVCEPRGARGPCAQAPRRRSRDAARLGARGPAPRDARGQRLGGVPRSRGRRAAVDAASHRGAAVRQRWLRCEGRGAARGAARGDSCGEGGRRHRPRRVHLLADRPMTATTTTLNGPVSRLDPATAYRRPASVPGLLRLDSNEGVLPSPALLGDFANADPELLRRYPDVSALEAALAARVGVAPERLTRTAGAVGSPYVVAVLRAAGGPYTVAAPSVALALSQLERGVEPLRAHVARVRQERRLLTARLAAAGLLPWPSQANFVLVECGPRAGSIRAGLAARGVLVRDFPARPGLDTALRITLPGDPADFERLSAALEGTLDAEGLAP